MKSVPLTQYNTLQAQIQRRKTDTKMDTPPKTNMDTRLEKVTPFRYGNIYPFLVSMLNFWVVLDIIYILLRLEVMVEQIIENERFLRVSYWPKAHEHNLINLMVTERHPT